MSLVPIPNATRLHITQVDSKYKFLGDGTYCFTILANGVVTRPSSACSNNDVKKFEIRSSESHRRMACRTRELQLPAWHDHANVHPYAHSLATPIE